MSRKYENSPIIEAVCEFQLSSDSQWDLTVHGFIYEKVKDVYKNKEERRIREVELTNIPEGLKQKVSIHERTLFLTDDKKTFIQIGQKLLAINRLAPYQTWKEFKPEIDRAFIAMTNTVEVKGLQRIGLRYINKIEIPSKTIDLDKYFEFKPSLGKNLSQITFESFVIGFVVSFFDGRDSCKVQLTSVESAQPDKCAFILDLDYYLAKPQTVSKDETLVWVENAHQKVEDIFEGCITDSLRNIFKEIK